MLPGHGDGFDDSLPALLAALPVGIVEIIQPMNRRAQLLEHMENRLRRRLARLFQTVAIGGLNAVKAASAVEQVGFHRGRFLFAAA